MEPKSCGVLDTPLSQSVTVFVGSDATLNSNAVIPGWRSASMIWSQTPARRHRTKRL
jgi:hypothetical protein